MAEVRVPRAEGRVPWAKGCVPGAEGRVPMVEVRVGYPTLYSVRPRKDRHTARATFDI